MRRQHVVSIIVAVLLLAMFIAEATSAIQESQTTDEGTHLGAGYSYLVKKDFRLNREHPPLIKQIAAVPLVLMGDRIQQPFDGAAWRNGDEWAVGKELLYYNSVPADTMLFLGRLPTMLLSLIIGLYVFKWTRELFGTGAGLLALGLYTFSPNIIAHSRYVTTDIAMMGFFYITIYYFYKYLKEHRAVYLWLTALFFAIAQASKFSAVFLIPIMLLLYLVALLNERGFPRTPFSIKHFFRLAGAIVLVTVTLLFAVYGFQITKPIDDPTIQHLLDERTELIQNGTVADQQPLVQRAVTWTDRSTPTGQRVWWFMEHMPIPFFAYFDGLVQVYTHNYFGHTAYLLGHYTEHGWWYYFPVGFLVKSPVVTILLALGLIVYACWFLIQSSRLYRHIKPVLHRIPPYIYFLVIPPLIYFAISMDSSLNIGIRHILVIYPFIFTMAGWALIRLWQQRRQWLRVVVVLGLAWYLAASLWIFPYYLAYFNEPSGGPGNGSRYLVDSNIDWGQDVKHLKEYIDDHGIPYVCLVYFGQADLSYYDIDYRYLPDTEHFAGIDNLNCVAAISVTALLSKEGEYSWLRAYTPDAKVGYSIFVYDFRKETTEF